jgi:hypothetical protein
LKPNKTKKENRKKAKRFTWIAMSGFQFTAELNETRRNEQELKNNA